MEVVNGDARTERRVAGSLIFGWGGSEELKSWEKTTPSESRLGYICRGVFRFVEINDCGLENNLTTRPDNVPFLTI
jgi:hypothetical protein